jgi:predicted acyl esterase
MLDGRRIWPAAVALIAAIGLPAASARAEVPPNARWSEAYIETPGEPRLHADVLLPKAAAAGTRLPVVLSIGPYFPHGGEAGPKSPANQGPQLRWRDLIEQGHLFERGYALVQVDLRGYGGSDGCNDLGGRGEQADVKRAVEWAVAQPWSTGRIAVYGKSYDAWTGIMALASKPHGLAAVVAMAPVADGYRAVFDDGVHYDLEWYGMGAIYDAYEATPPTPFDSPEYIRAGATSTDPACYAENALQSQVSDTPDSPYWRERALPAARGSDVPVLWSHGFMDNSAKPDNILPVWSTLTGPHRAWFGQFAHDRPNQADLTGRGGWFDELFRFLDRYVKGDAGARPDLDPPVEVADGRGRWRAEAQWPPADAVERTVAVHPGTYTDTPGNFAEHDPAGGPATGQGLWSVTDRLGHEAWISGAPRASVETSSAASRAVMIALLYDIAPDRHATLITRGAAMVTGSRTTFDLYPQDWPVERGHRLGLLLTGSDQDWYLPAHSGAAVQVASGALHVPFLRFRRDRFLAAAVTPAMSARRPITIPDATLRTAAVAAALPPPLVDPSAVDVQGAAARPARWAALRVGMRRAGRRLVVTVRGVGGARVRLTLERGGAVIARRTAVGRRGVARATLSLHGPGAYRVRAVLVGTPSRSGVSRVVWAR